MTAPLKQQTVLVIDDNLYTLNIVQHALEKAYFNVLVASSGEEGLELIIQNGLPHLAIVDLNMPPGMSGFEFSHKVHQFSDLPVIMLTAIDEETTIVEGLDKHAEDYMTKPFSPSELIARVRRVLRRMGGFAYASEPIARIDERLSINFPKRKAIVNDKLVSLTPIETKLLYILMRNAGKTITTEFIIRRIWPQEPVYEDRLHVHLHRLRRKIEGKSDFHYIISERGQGYLFQPTRDETK